MRIMIFRRCERCDEIIYRFPKKDNVSDLVKGAEIALHMITCDRERYNAMCAEALS